MHLLIDGQALQTSTSRHRGIGRYSSNLLRAVAAVRPNWRIEVVQNSTLPPISPSDRNGLPILSFSPPRTFSNELCELNERYYADWLTARAPDGVLLLSHCEGWDAVVPSFCGARPCVFGIAYDLIPLVYPEHYLTNFSIARWYAHRFRQLLNSDALLAISEATAQDVRALGGEAVPPVVNIGGAVDPLFAPLSPRPFAARAERLRQRFGLQRDFILYVGAPDYRKNLHGAIRAFAALPVECRAALDLALVCRLSRAERAALEETARQAGMVSHLRLIPSVSDEELRALYQMCRLFFFPSLYEGLGLPVLEALHCGAPVAASNCSSLPEYAGPVSWLGDPTSPAAMARLLQEALAEPREARRAEREAFARNFSWAKTAERACTVMERCVQHPSRPASRRRRLAWVAPLTAMRDEEVEYTTQALAALAERFDIEVISPPSRCEAAEALACRHLILTAQEVRSRHNAAPYDLFVYPLYPSLSVCPASSPLPLYSGGEGLGVRGQTYKKGTPSPQPLSPEYRGEGLKRQSLRAPALLDMPCTFPGLLLLHDFSADDMRQLVEINLLSVAAACHVARNHDPRCLAGVYADCVDWAIRRHERNDGLWRGFAVHCLADSPDNTDAILDSWAALRARGQQHLSARRCRPSSRGRGDGLDPRRRCAIQAPPEENSAISTS